VLALLGLLAEAWPDREVRYAGQFIIDALRIGVRSGERIGNRLLMGAFLSVTTRFLKLVK
jgi:hypothetical protein